MLQQNHSVSDLIKNIDALADNNEDKFILFTEKVLNNRQRTSTINGILKAEAVYHWAQVLKKHKIETFSCLYLLTEKVEEELKNIRGQKRGISLQYFKMLCGDDSYCKPDRHIRNFVFQIAKKIFSDDYIQKIITEEALALKSTYPHMTPRLLDYAIWQYMSTK